MKRDRKVNLPKKAYLPTGVRFLKLKPGSMVVCNSRYLGVAPTGPTTFRPFANIKQMLASAK